MLKKLIAYDLKRTRPVMTGITLFTFLLSIIIVIADFIREKLYNDQTEILESGLYTVHSENIHPLYYYSEKIMAAAFLLIPVLATLAAIYMIRYYYKTIYQTQAYLSFTLPAKITEIVNSKILVTFIWALLFVVPPLSIGVFGFNLAERLYDPYYKELAASGYTADLIILLLAIFFIIFEIIVQIMAFFFCLSIGQLCHNHKLMGTILSYIGIAIASMFLFFYNMHMHQIKKDTWWWSYDDIFCPANIISEIILFIGFYVATIKITEKDLNLE